MGGISDFKLKEDDLFKDTKPKIIILLGKNGSGKTTILSTITDFIYELEEKFFDDILPKKGLGHSFYKTGGGLNRKTGTDYYYAFADIRESIKNSEELNYYSYLDKNGDINVEQVENEIGKKLSDIIKNSWQSKNRIITVDEQDNIIKNDIINNSYCAFPSNRSEIPFRKNDDSLSSGTLLDDGIKIEGQLDKPLLISTSLKDIKGWIMDIYLDSKIKISEVKYNHEFKKFFANIEVPSNNIIFTNGLTNIEKIISKILGFDAGLFINFRGNNSSRLGIHNKNTNKIFVPGLDNLSAGQSALLVLFLSIIKYSDKGNLYKCVGLNQIEGIVLIDEIDLHLDINLQKNILPELISLFPKIQFIITSHSPFFLYGMSQKFNKDNMLMIDVTDSTKLESFDEFIEIGEAYDIFDNIYGYSENNINYSELISGGENQTIEFKSSFKWNIEEKKKDENILFAVIKTIAGFLNTEGGTLFVGVDDHGTILGLDDDIALYKHKSWDSLLQDVSNVIMRYFSKKIHHIKILKQKINGKDILIFRIRKSKAPCFIEWKGKSEFYVRLPASTRKLTGDNLISYQKEHF